MCQQPGSWHETTFRLRSPIYSMMLRHLAFAELCLREANFSFSSTTYIDRSTASLVTNNDAISWMVSRFGLTSDLGTLVGLMNM